jgi:hypothetical protein
VAGRVSHPLHSVSNRGVPNVNLDEVKYKMCDPLAFLGDIQPKVNGASLWLGLLNKYLFTRAA